MDDPSLLYPVFSESDPRLIDTIFNVSSLTSGIFNNSIFQYAGLVIVGIILFEIALYALDVYYNQTYLNQSTFNQRYDQYYFKQQDPNNFVQDFPAYLDPYYTTYRSLNSGWNFNIMKVLEWISVLNDSYNMADDALNYIDCQKRAICEIWRPENNFKHVDKIDLIFKYAEMMNLPDEILGIIDEFSDARIEGLETQEDCEQLYDECPSETVVHIMKKIKNLMWRQLFVLNHTNIHLQWSKSEQYYKLYTSASGVIPSAIFLKKM